MQDMHDGRRECGKAARRFAAIFFYHADHAHPTHHVIDSLKLIIYTKLTALGDHPSS